jgi:hypothetical protein
MEQKDHWQEQSLALAADCDFLRYKLLTLEKSKEKDVITIESLQQVFYLFHCLFNVYC